MSGRLIGDRDVTAPAAEVARRGDGVPELRALSAHVGRGQHRLRAEAGARAEGRDPEPRRARRRRCSTSRSTWIASRRRSRAASASGSRWAARSSAGRTCSCSTSRSRTWTRSCACRRGRRSRRSSGGSRVTTVYVTHDQVEAMTMGDRVAVLDRGVLQQVDTPHRLFTSPANMFVAGFIGSPAMNLHEVSVTEGVASRRLRRADPPRCAAARSNGRVVLGFRPEALELVGDGDDGLRSRCRRSRSSAPTRTSTGAWRELARCPT